MGTGLVLDCSPREFKYDPHEITRSAGESAGLRDDAGFGEAKESWVYNAGLFIVIQDQDKS